MDSTLRPLPNLLPHLEKLTITLHTEHQHSSRQTRISRSGFQQNDGTYEGL